MMSVDLARTVQQVRANSLPVDLCCDLRRRSKHPQSRAESIEVILQGAHLGTQMLNLTLLNE